MAKHRRGRGCARNALDELGIDLINKNRHINSSWSDSNLVCEIVHPLPHPTQFLVNYHYCFRKEGYTLSGGKEFISIIF